MSFERLVAMQKSMAISNGIEICFVQGTEKHRWLIDKVCLQMELERVEGENDKNIGCQNCLSFSAI